MRRQSLFVRLLLIFIVLILPLQIIGLYSIKSSNAMLEDTVEDLTHSNIEYLAATLESRLDSIGSQMDDMLYASTSLFKPQTYSAERSPYSYWLSVREIMDSLLTIKRRSDFAQELFVYYPATGLRISTKWGVYDNDPAETNAVCEAYLENRMPYFILHGKMVVCRSMYNNAGRDNVFLCTVIAQEALENLLASGVFNTYPAAITDPDGNALCEVSAQLPETDICQVSAGGEAFTIVRYLPMSILRSRTQRSEWLLALFVAMSLPIFAVYCLLIRRYVKRPVQQLVDGYRRVENGDLAFSIPESRTAKEFTLLTQGFNHMLREWKNTVDTVTRQQLLMQEMELKQLQSQINPHFLYNTFFLLSHMIEDDDTQSAVPVLRDLGKYFKYITRTERDIVTLRDEYDYANIYLGIQKKRFENNLQLFLSPLPDSAASLCVPKLILQPLFENVFTHARNTADGVIEVHCEIRETDETVSIRVFDNGTGMTKEHLEKLQSAIADTRSSMETTALINIARRMSLAKMGEMTLDTTSGGGLSVTLLFRKER